MGQDEVSVDNTKAKIEERQAQKDILKPADRWILSHDGGKSAVPLTDPIEVIRGPMGYVIADGHHDFLLSLHVGAQTIAVKVKADYSQMQPEAFWEKLKKENLTYLKRSPKSLAITLPSPAEFLDRPNRYLASLLALKVNAQETKGQIQILGQRAPNSPVWVKLNNSLPFIEFHLADRLDRAGVRYDASWGKKIPPEAIEAAREALMPYQKELGVPLLESEAQAQALLKNQQELSVFLRKAQIKGCAMAF